MRIPRRLAVVVCAAVALAELALPGSVLASCNPMRGPTSYQWVGSIQTNSLATGVKSQLVTYVPYVPTGQFSYAWVMLPGTSANEWSQIGNYQVGGGIRHMSAQVNNGGTPTQVDWSPWTDGSYHIYEVDYSAHGTSLYADGTLKWQYNSLIWTPAGAQIESETTSAAAQMMGATQSVQFFLSNQIKTSSWATFAGFANNSNSTIYGNSGIASSFYTWDKGCPGT